MTSISALLSIYAMVPFIAQEPIADLPDKPIAPVTLNDLGAKKTTTPDASSKLTVAIFVIPECPIANRYSPEIKRICTDYEKKGVAFRIVYSDPDVSVAQAKVHMKDFGFTCPGLVDKKMLLAKAVGATISPEAAVFDTKGRILYRGQIDDLYVGHGNRRPTPKRRDLRIALDEALAGKEISKPVVTPTGCFLRVKG